LLWEPHDAKIGNTCSANDRGIIRHQYCETVAFIQPMWPIIRHPGSYDVVGFAKIVFIGLRFSELCSCLALFTDMFLAI
jgi:hypothetical protein